MRALQAYKAMSEMMIMNSLVKIKDAPPYSPEMEEQVLMNSMARAVLNSKTGSYQFPVKLPTEVQHDLGNLDVVKGMVLRPDNITGVGVDQGSVT
jgi:fatty acid synthase subunit alpha, fungi type